MIDIDDVMEMFWSFDDDMGVESSDSDLDGDMSDLFEDDGFETGDATHELFDDDTGIESSGSDLDGDMSDLFEDDGFKAGDATHELFDDDTQDDSGAEAGENDAAEPVADVHDDAIPKMEDLEDSDEPPVESIISGAELGVDENGWFPLEELVRPIQDWWHDLLDMDEGLIYPSQFTEDGETTIDPQNGCSVVGDVARDIEYVNQQTSSSCSLMAQEQFVERAIGKPIPEDYLEWRAEEWGVYSPTAGTNWVGQTMVLEHFDIEYESSSWADVDDLERVTMDGTDAIIGVDARYFYNDASIPEGAMHAVAVVGKGYDTETGDLKGFYITDSNYPNAARFLTTAELEQCWAHDMITISPDALAA